MDIELDEDEYFIREQLMPLPPQHQVAFALLVAERLTTSLDVFLPDRWREAASAVITESWGVLENVNGAADRLKLVSSKLEGEEIGMHENPVITHAMKTVDFAISLSTGKLKLDDFLIELHHLVAVIEATTKRPEVEAEALAAEEDYFLQCCNCLVNANKSDSALAHDAILAQVSPPPSTIFG